MTGFLEGIVEQPGRVDFPFRACIPHIATYDGFQIAAAAGCEIVRAKLRVVEQSEAPVIAVTGPDEASPLEWCLFDGSIWTPLELGTRRRASLPFARETGLSNYWGGRRAFTSNRIPHDLIGIPDGWSGGQVFGAAIPSGGTRLNERAVIAPGWDEKIEDAERIASSNLMVLGDVVWRRIREPVLEVSIEAGSFLSVKTATLDDRPQKPWTTRFRIDRPESAFAFRRLVRGSPAPYGLHLTNVLRSDLLKRVDERDAVLEAVAVVLEAGRRSEIGRLPLSALSALRDLRRLPLAPETLASATSLLFELGDALGISEDTRIMPQSEIDPDNEGKCETEERIVQALLLPLKRLSRPIETTPDEADIAVLAAM